MMLLVINLVFALNALAPVLTELMGGSADLTPSNKTQLKCSKDFQKNSREGRYIRFGVREHAMAAIGNGLSAYGGIIPYTATFLNFIEYCFPAVRLSALSEHQQLYIMTHDSIGLGEDGPTHQAIEALTLCRSTPNLLTIRPADGNEVMGAYVCALENHHGPTVLAFSRQNLPQLATSSIDNVKKGGYIVSDVDAKSVPELIFVSTGSEVTIAIKAKDLLKDKFKVRVVSMPAPTLFDKQSVEYRRSILVPGVPVVSIEASQIRGWERYSHIQIGMRTFGASAPAAVVYDHFSITPPKIAARVVEYLEQMKQQSDLMKMPTISLLPVHFDNL